MKKLGDCLELIHHQNDEILSRDAEVSRLKTEIVKMKLDFAERTIQEYENSQAVGKPSGLSSHISAARYLRPSYASIARLRETALNLFIIRTTRSSAVMQKCRG